MEILQVCPFSYGEIGGVTVHIRNISERLVRKHNVTVYATQSKWNPQRSETKNGVRVEMFRRYAPSDSYFFSWEMLLRLRKTHFDIVHAHCYHAFPMHFSIVAKCKKLILTTHFHGHGHTTFRNSLFKLFQPFGKRTLKKADKIIAVSEHEKTLLCQHFRFNSDKIVVIPNGVDLREFSGLKKRNRDFRSILYVGYLSAFKGSQYLVEVLPKLSDDVVLEIVGEGPLRPFLEQRAQELKVHHRVKFLQNLPRRELLQKYADADVFVLLSKYEAYSLVVAEALAAGTPCIVAKTSALTEWVDNESCFGVGVPVNLNELARLIDNVIDRGVNRKVTEKWIGTKILDWDEVTECLEKIYSQ